MLNTYIYAISSVVVVSLISFIGILTLSIATEKLKKGLIYLVSFAAGGLFGGAFIHLLPKIVKREGFTLEVSLYLLAGIVIMFLVEKVVRWRHCHHPITEGEECKPQPVAIMNLFGDGVHNFIDGLIIGASFLVSVELGITTTIAVIIHEVPQEIGDYGVLVHGGFSRVKALFVNFLIALTSVAGTVLALFLSNYVQNISSILIPFAVGNFVYIAGADLIPELHHEDPNVTKSVLQLLTFMAGIGVMWLVLIVNMGFVK
ncbi:MAG: ZIP family metal transporter [Candidatus Magasanikbacteria bacterium]